MSGYLKLREILLLYWATCGSVPGRGGRSGRGHRRQTPRETTTIIPEIKLRGARGAQTIYRRFRKSSFGARRDASTLCHNPAR
eukprot:scaffold7934_cov59-Attheya_sp.AAC.1